MMMKKILVIVVLGLVIFYPIKIHAAKGCCSHHGGVSGCSSSGRQLCRDGTVSPSCTCQPEIIYGCTDRKAKNFDSNATRNDGSCIYYVYGCTNSLAKNYNPKAEKDDGSCEIVETTKLIKENTTITTNKTYTSSTKKKTVIKTTSTTSSKQKNNDSTSSDNTIGSIICIGTIASGIYIYKKRKRN